jgi:preprotein translocase subunit SecD
MFRPLRLWTAMSVVVLALAATAGQASAATACPNMGFTVVEPAASPQTRPVKDGRRHTIFVRRDAITATADISEIKLQLDRYDTLLQMKLKPEAAARLHDATTNHSGMRLALVADNQVVSAVTWEGPYGMDADLGVQLSLGGPAPRLRPLVNAIRKCIGTSGG